MSTTQKEWRGIVADLRSKLKIRIDECFDTETLKELVDLSETLIVVELNAYTFDKQVRSKE